MKVGVHLRNDDGIWPESDFRAIEAIRPNSVKVLSNTNPLIIERLRKMFPDLVVVVRLYGSGFGRGHQHPGPDEFVQQVSPHIEKLIRFTKLFQVHNEPNHMHGIEGWGQTAADAVEFNLWFLHVIYRLKSKFGDIQTIFPGLAVPHNDINWLNWCSLAVTYADAITCHDYWQNPGPDDRNHLSEAWGLKHRQYHNIRPEKPIFIGEAGNSNRQNGYKLEESTMAAELMEWFAEVNKDSYVRSICPFLLSSPDPRWDNDGFTWIDKTGRHKEIVGRLASR